MKSQSELFKRRVRCNLAASSLTMFTGWSSEMAMFTGWSSDKVCPEKCCLFNRTAISGRTELQLPRKADAADLLASRNPRPPYQIVSVACIQDRCEIEEQIIDWRASRKPILKRPNCFSALQGGVVRIRWFSLQRPRQLRSKCNSIWGSSRSTKWDWNWMILSTHLQRKSSKNASEPTIGEPVILHQLK